MAKGSIFSRLFSGQQKKLSGEAQEQILQPLQTEAPSLNLVFFIVEWEISNIISNIFIEEKVRFHFHFKGIRIAEKKILDLFGIGEGNKAVLLCLEQAVLVPILIKEARKKLRFRKHGQGVAFSIPLSAINDPVLLVFKQSIHKNQKISLEQALSKAEGDTMANEVSRNTFTHDLIVSIVNRGYSDELMDTAHEAGASGGTVISARGQGHEGAIKFFGISVQDEKEIILILCSKENKVSIMQAISKEHGLNTNAKGIVFSLPADNVTGLGND